MIQRSNLRVKKLIRQYGGWIMPYRELSREAQLAMAHYMAIAGEAWKPSPDFDRWNAIHFPYDATKASHQKHFQADRPYYVQRYGNRRFGFVVIPMVDLGKSIEKDQDCKDECLDFDHYHHWYVDTLHNPLPRHKKTNLWPIILSDFAFETLQDGWHRLHAYYRRGIKQVPCLFYA